MATSTFQASMRKSIEAREEIVSTRKRAGWFVRFIAFPISSKREVTPVDVSLCTTATALMTCPRSAARRSEMASGSAPWRQSPGRYSTLSPRASAMFLHILEKAPVSGISIVSPREQVFTKEASQAPCPAEG